jgi:hypothetical protein
LRPGWRNQQDQAASDISGLEGFTHRPDFQKGGDALRRNGGDVAQIIADTFPTRHGAPGDSFLHGKRRVFLAGYFRHGLDGGISPC